jgi:Mor family transcriptional regulator
MDFPEYIIERFWSRVQLPEPEKYVDECWIWTGSREASHVRKNYGIFKFSINGIQLTYRAHRLCYELYHGEIPDGLHVLHECDNVLCVNVNHLWLGTNKDNVDDKVRKNRQTYGEKSGTAILTNKDVIDIYNYCMNTNESVSEIAKHFNLRVDHLKRLIYGKNWKHLYQNLTEEEQIKIRSVINSKFSNCLNEEIVRQIKYVDSKTMKYSEMTKKYNVAQNTIYNILSGRTWSHV